MTSVTSRSPAVAGVVTEVQTLERQVRPALQFAVVTQAEPAAPGAPQRPLLQSRPAAQSAVAVQAVPAAKQPAFSSMRPSQSSSVPLQSSVMSMTTRPWKVKLPPARAKTQGRVALLPGPGEAARLP